MDPKVDSVERAFQMAQSGKFGSVDNIKRALSSEGYSAAHICGKTLTKQLRGLIADAKRPDGPENSGLAEGASAE
jgi:hypothetical protein